MIGDAIQLVELPRRAVGTQAKVALLLDREGLRLKLLSLIFKMARKRLSLVLLNFLRYLTIGILIRLLILLRIESLKGASIIWILKILGPSHVSGLYLTLERYLVLSDLISRML